MYIIYKHPSIYVQRCFLVPGGRDDSLCLDAQPAAEDTGATAPDRDREPAVVFPGNDTQ